MHTPRNPGVCVVCLFVCLLMNYNVAFDRINVMATINVKQRINVHTMGTSRPSLAGQCPPRKKGPNPIPDPPKHPPKTTNKNLRNQEKFPILHPKNRKKATGKPQGTKPGRTPQQPTQ